MSRIPNSDGDPLIGEVIVVVDESAQNIAGGLLYVVSAAAVLQVDQAQFALGALFEPSRKRGFHWAAEGTSARNRMLDLIIDGGVVALTQCKAVGRTSQESARRQMFDRLGDWAYDEGATHVVIEVSDVVTMSRDRSSFLDRYNEFGGVPFAYDWRTKTEPLLWISDAIAGAVGEWLAGRASQWYERLAEAGVVTNEYLR